MKCEIVKDLLPMYIDGLTSQDSNREIEKHLRECEECRSYYQEMTGKIPDVLPKAQPDEVGLLKKERKKRRKNKVIIAIIIVILSIVPVIMWKKMTPVSVNYDDVRMEYGITGNIVYLEIQPKNGGQLYFSGHTKAKKDENGEQTGEESKMNVTKTSGKSGKYVTRLESELSSETQEVIWELTFRDKTVIIRNGELVSEK